MEAVDVNARDDCLQRRVAAVPSSGVLARRKLAVHQRSDQLTARIPGLDIVFIESGGDNLAATFSPDLADLTLYVISVCQGGDIPRKGGPGITRSDFLVVNKADGNTQKIAELTRQEYESAISLIRPSSVAWRPRALLASALERTGLDEIWASMQAHREALEANGEFEVRRRQQNRDWMWSLVDQGLRAALHGDPKVAQQVATFEEEVQSQKRTPAAAARGLLGIFRDR